jgi:hypothetical protein
MTKYSEIAELPDGNKLFIHYNEEHYPVWLEYLNTKEDRSIKYGRIGGLDVGGSVSKTIHRKTHRRHLRNPQTRKVKRGICIGTL